MDAILDILQPKSTEPPAFSFGKEVFQYSLVRYLNSKQIVTSDPRLWYGIVDKYKEFYHDTIKDYDHWCQETGSQQNFAVIGERFMTNHEGLIQSLQKPLKQLVKVEQKDYEVNFPSIKVPSAYRYQARNEYCMNKAFNKGGFDILSYIPNNEYVINELIIKYQFRMNLTPTPYHLIDSVMRAQVYEGELLYSILIKKIIQLHPELNTPVIINDFLLHSKHIKTIIGHESRLIERIMSFKHGGIQPYHKILQQSQLDIHSIIDKFHQFLVMHFNYKNGKLIKFLTDLMFHHKRHPDSIEELYSKAVSEFNSLLQPEFPKVELKRNQVTKKSVI